MSDNITITKKEYFDLKCADEKLNMLINSGVDNWDWYGDALNPDEGQSYTDLVSELKTEILGAN